MAHVRTWPRDHLDKTSDQIIYRNLLTKMGAPGLVMEPCIVEIDSIVIREVQYQLEGNQCRNEEVWPMWAGRPRIDRIVIRLFQYQLEVNRWLVIIREVQYQLLVNRCRNEKVRVKGNFGWVWPMWAGRPRVGNEAMHTLMVEIDRIVIREFHQTDSGDNQNIHTLFKKHGDNKINTCYISWLVMANLNC
ncbi:hypothetical protein DPMN_044988 [Dreissena polymorpha]|uniref:Uncharacterized protein n=1 Tax=Dreissena polymorpha TaxID=45954 RepID=A0A9D4HZ84_DREPO|nr:hypothetical protein DPMN_044988 [Dreissena polymorpha]